MDRYDEMLQRLIIINESHMTGSVSINTYDIARNNEYRTNEFFFEEKELKELVVLPDGNYTFESITKTNLVSRFDANRLQLMPYIEELLVTIEQNRRLSSNLKEEIIKDVDADGITIEVDVKKSTITTYVGVNPDYAKLHDPVYFEQKLREIFCEDEAYNTIRKHMMLFAFENNVNPYIVFTGARGIGKTVYGEMMRAIFCAFTHNASEDEFESPFNEWKKSVLLVIDEALSKTKKTYRELKKLGNKVEVNLNGKYKQPRAFTPNSTVIILSNDPVPFYVSANEVAQEVGNNQFYVWRSPVTKLPKYDHQLTDKMKKLIVNYVRKVLRPEYEQYILTEEYANNRYRMEVPITSHERNMFEQNMTMHETRCQYILDVVYEQVRCGNLVKDVDGNVFIPSKDLLSTPYSLLNETMTPEKLASILKADGSFKKYQETGGNRRRGYIVKIPDDVFFEPSKRSFVTKNGDIIHGEDTW